MVMWSPSQTGGFPPGTPVSSHTKTIRTQTSVPTGMLNISCITSFPASQDLVTKYSTWLQFTLISYWRKLKMFDPDISRTMID